MNDVAKHAGDGVFDAVKRLDFLSPKTSFDGDDYVPFSPSFDIDGGAARIVEKFDRDGDGAIDLGSGSGLSEVLLRETSLRHPGGSSSIARLARYADEAGNRDGSATVEEIADVIRRFDQGSEGDGRLSGQERETFLEVFGEQTTQFRHRHPSPFPGMRGSELIGIRPYTKGP